MEIRLNTINIHFETQEDMHKAIDMLDFPVWEYDDDECWAEFELYSCTPDDIAKELNKLLSI